MTTTANDQGRPTGAPRRGITPVLVTVAIGLVLGVAAGVTTGVPGVWGVVVGVVLTCASLGLGSLVLAWVTEVSPAMSLVVALMTYTLQVVLLLAAYVVLQSSAEARDAVAGPWLGGTVIATTVVWLALQVRDLMRSRQPYFDLPSDAAGATSSKGASAGPEVGTT